MLLRHSLSYFLARSAAGIFNFLAIALYTRLLTPERYGFYALVRMCCECLDSVAASFPQSFFARHQLKGPCIKESGPKPCGPHLQ